MLVHLCKCATQFLVNNWINYYVMFDKKGQQWSGSIYYDRRLVTVSQDTRSNDQCQFVQRFQQKFASVIKPTVYKLLFKVFTHFRF